MAEPTILMLVDRFRRELMQMERAAATEMVRTYGQVWKRIKAQLDDLTAQIETARAAGETVSPSWLFERQRLQSLQRQVEREIATFARYAERSIVAQQSEAVLAAQSHAEQLTLAALGEPPPGVFVTFSRLPSGAITDLVGALQDGSPLSTLLDQLGPQASRGVREALIAGVATGQGPREIARRARQAMGGSLSRALTIARTEVLRSYRESSRRSYQVNDDVVKGWVWHSALGLRTCASCFPAGVVVSGPRPEKVFSRYYTGDVVVIKTASGKQLTATPNHPILTRDGWIAAGLLKKGDDVVCRAASEGASLGVNVDDYHRPTPIEQVAEALGMVPTEMPCAAPDFHGDGKDSEVYVVWSNGLLRDDRNTPVSEHLKQGELGLRGVRPSAGGGLLLPFNGGLDTLFERNEMGTRVIVEDLLARSQGDALATGSVGFLEGATDHAVEPQASGYCGAADIVRAGEGQLGFTGHIPGADFLIWQAKSLMSLPTILAAGDGIALLLGSQETALAQNSSEPLATDAESGRNLLRRLAGQVSLDRVLNVDVRCFSGHVYNLQTRDGWYEANGIIAHNCWAMHGTEHTLDERLDDHPNGRCSMIPWTKTWEELGFTGISETRASVPKGVDLFERLPDADKKRILGKAGFRAYKEGAVKMEDFVGRKGSREWGTMRYARSLRDILGDDKARKRQGA